MKEKSEKKRVVMGLSGGVDSSVAAFLLQEKGFLVTGVFLKFWEEGKCCNSDAQRRARKVCRELNIPFYVVDVREEFRERVVDHFVESYKRGETPNPCVICNREIKFGTLMEKLTSFGADHVATGHYVRVKEGDGGMSLFKGKDGSKDQSYFLWRIDKEWLSKLLFPIGEFTKEEVREKAEELDLPTAKTEESQEVCFIEEGVRNFLKKYIDERPGDIIDKEGRVLGKHDGIFFYTEGQRRGLDLSGGPYYVLKKDKKRNVLVVTKNEEELYKKEFHFKEANFLKEVKFPFRSDIRVRYGSELVEGVVKEGEVELSESQRAVAPGQSVVFYNGEEVLGGGIITN